MILNPKAKLGLVIIVLSIGLPLLAFVAGNLLKIPDDASYWNHVVNAFAVAMFVVPITLLYLLVSLAKGKVKPELEPVPKKKSPLVKIVKTILLIIGVLVILRFANNMGWLSAITGYSKEESGFRRALSDQYALVSSGTEADIHKLNQNFVAPKDRDKANQAYEETKAELAKVYQKVQLHGVQMNGDVAYADRTVTTCENHNCDNILAKNRVYKRYHYDKGHWYMDSQSVYCPRTEYYKMEPEFIRAIKLVDETHFASPEDGGEAKIIFEEMLKCVDINYSSNESDLNGNEGVFRFRAGQNTSMLSIYVSPKYKSNDDLTMAILLSHELTHAFNYVIGLDVGRHESCYQDEADAFQIQNGFLMKLNPKEQNTIISNMARGGTPELRAMTQALTRIPQMKGATYDEKALRYVMLNPAYQEQCKGR